MKKYLLVYIVALCTLMGCKDNSGLYGLLTDYDLRISELEKLCEDINTNVQSIQVIIEAQQTGDYITAITPIKNGGVEIGYTITFAKHEPITIYHGQNGTNGTNGADGHTPVIGVAKDTDGVYYWTLDGKWLLDSNGNKLRVTGQDGKDGQDGTNGKDGQDGTNGTNGANGQDGVTPQLKIEGGYWYISYNNGATWTKLGKATGEDGEDGAKGDKGDKGDKGETGATGATGPKGEQGDSMFKSVTQDENYVYFTLADGTVIKIAKGNGNNQSNNDFIFTITYDANGGEGVMERDTFYYGYAAEIKACSFTMDGSYFMEWNTDPKGKGAPYQAGFLMPLDRNITLYAIWSETPGYAVDLGLSVKWATCNVGAASPQEFGDFFAWGEISPKNTYTWDNYKWGSDYNLTKYCYHSQWGRVDNIRILESIDDVAIVEWGNDWRMPTDAEMQELINNCNWTWTAIGGINGYEVTSKSNGNSIFLPAAGYYNQSSNTKSGSAGNYWSVNIGGYNPHGANSMSFTPSSMSLSEYSRHLGCSVRPVCP
ncbi:MAG: PL29 family lyase N-terminal domain-containing protein [Paludibacteraceae bacterium]|nr:PL29 family lyase N-terminal domain-containing protein [Paludibacteraceae bacterium]